MAAFEEVGICPELITACEEMGWSLYVPVVVFDSSFRRGRQGVSRVLLARA